ncbi:MAG: glycosyltransferase [Candidatus Hydrogenedentota bacterium]|uniref:Glycosyltransferase n=1 Tax=Sumerlaea chitinivorans TaxID=2250252 RepID=A0A2Z4Y3D2_SUMC1|nr:Glycosyltransferase [Candidatus Sumerlaea chitinivorans]RMH24102.1 MAG: glycosyltransferase [Candidatus Hydrogenedentota bacterium]GIX44384.1 MAG: glycosyl transferase [Candidatus Sumerlaea sp.]
MIQRPRVLHIYKDYFPPVRGGIENTINLMARGTRDEFETSVLVCRGPAKAGTEVLDGVRVRRVPEWCRVWSAPLSPAFVRALREEAQRADLLHFHHPNPTGDLAYLLGGIQTPFVMTYHSDVVRQRAAMIFFAHVQRRMMDRARRIMPTSPNYVESSPWLRKYREKLRIVPLGIELDRFQKSPTVEKKVLEIRQQWGEQLILFVGRLRYYKGLHFLIEAMRSVPSGKLLIIGTGPEESKLKRMVRDWDLAERCVFLGELDDQDVVAYLHASRVFCLPSHLRSEAFGICQIEAMACGLPVVSTALATGVPYVNRHGETGLVVEPGNPTALAEALNRLLSDPALRERFSRAASEQAQQEFSAERMCARLKAVYWEVLQESGSGFRNE